MVLSIPKKSIWKEKTKKQHIENRSFSVIFGIQLQNLRNLIFNEKKGTKAKYLLMGG